MKEFLKVLKRFVPPYKKYLVLSLIFHVGCGKIFNKEKPKMRKDSLRSIV